MIPRTLSNSLLRRGLPAVCLALVLITAGCGGGGDDEAGDAQPTDAPTTVAPVDEGADDDADGEAETAEAVAYLPIGSEPQEGMIQIAPSCDDDADDGDGNDDTDYRTWIVYDVDEAWKPTAMGSGGSGGPNDSENLTFLIDREDPRSPRVDVDIEWDSMGPDGTVLGDDGEPFESFDYTIEVYGGPGDERSTDISYESVGTFDVGDRETELFYRDPAQSEEDLGTTAQYKARVEAYALPMSPTNPSDLTEFSFVVTVEFDADEVDLAHEDIEAIVSSMTIPECTWNKILADTELITGRDLDGDGEVRDAADAQAELQEQLDEAMEDLPPEARERMEEMREQLQSGN